MDHQTPSSHTFKRPSSAKGHRRRQVHGDSDGADDISADAAPQPKQEDSSAVDEKGDHPKKPPVDSDVPKEKAKASSVQQPPSSELVQGSIPRPMSSRPAAPRKRNTANTSVDKSYIRFIF